MAKCIFCSSRKGKRNCPALGGVVCSQCCGSEAGKKIACPQDCFFLGKSKQYFMEKQEIRDVSNFEHDMAAIIGHEHEHLDILQNIEFAISRAAGKDERIVDRQVQTALEYLLEMGKMQHNLPSRFLPEPTQPIGTIIDAIDEVVSMRDALGANEDVKTRMQCIYRVLDSVKTHYHPADSRSYINFISGFLP